MPDEVAKASLEADVTRWDAGLDRAEARVQTFAESVQTRVGSMSEKVQTFASSAGEKLKAMAAEAEGEGTTLGIKLADKISGGLGTAIGTLLLPGVGTVIGGVFDEYVGPALTDAVKGVLYGGALDDALGQLDSFGALLKEQADETNVAWVGLGTALSTWWGSVATAVREADFGESLHKLRDFDTEGIEGKFGTLFGKVKAAGDDMVGQTFLRLEGFVDSLFERFQAPLAKVADIVQAIGVEIGVVSSETASWGDAIKDVDHLGNRLVTGLVVGLGYVQDAMRLAAAGFIVVFVGPIVESTQAAVAAFATMADEIKPLLDYLGVGDVGKFAGDIGKFSKRVNQLGDDLLGEGIKFEQGQKNAAWFNDSDNRKRWGEKNAWDDWTKADFKDAGGWSNVDGLLKKPELPEAQSEGAKVEKVQAATAGSAAAAKAIADASRAADSPEVRAAAAAEESARLAAQMAEALKQINAKTPDPEDGPYEGEEV